MPEILKFDSPKNQSSIIKVIGVGGGGSNAVNHMFRQGITGVDFIICNTDAQSMESSPVPTKIQLGATLTDGLGAGASPTVGRNAALENAEDLKQVLEKGTKMLFITAGLGGGTGTGAAPVIAQISKDLDILTVGIVTIPFAFEGRKRRLSAEEGIRQLKQHVDALLIISNDKLRLLCGDLPLSEAFNRADNVLTTAAKGIAEIITVVGYINVDFEDVKTVMKTSGVAIMGTGVASGKERARLAVVEALNSPLLDNNDINGASNILLYISSGKQEITMDEVTEITDYIQEKTQSTGDIIWGNGYDDALEDQISVTIIATGFDEDHKQKDPTRPADVTVIPLYDDTQKPKTERRILHLDTETPAPRIPTAPADQPASPEVAVTETSQVAFQLESETDTSDPTRTYEFIVDQPSPQIVNDRPETLVHTFLPGDKDEIIDSHIKPDLKPTFHSSPNTDSDVSDFLLKKSGERVGRLRQLSEKLKTHIPIEQNLQELENIPAYQRRKIDLLSVTPSSESHISAMSLTKDPEKPVENKNDNAYLNPTTD
ncbi:MAG: cell division protein FtsZ [Bacteroidota bacterium]